MLLNASFVKERLLYWDVVSRETLFTQSQESLKVKALLEFTVTNDVSCLSAFLGCAGYQKHVFFLPFVQLVAKGRNLSVNKGT